jgi:hypothetical protein
VFIRSDASSLLFTCSRAIPSELFRDGQGWQGYDTNNDTNMCCARRGIEAPKNPHPVKIFSSLRGQFFGNFGLCLGSIRSLDCGYGVTSKTAPQPMGLQ